MARLNEAPPPTESVEALKRRFLRQNRELAKNNSIQSLKISALETETSRLIAENATLREEILHLQSRLDDGHAIHLGRFSDIRNNLEARIGEINALVADLGALQKCTSGDEKSNAPGALLEGHARAVRPPKPDAEADQEGKLPTIDEDKCYPRRTLGPDDIQGLRLSDQTNESPDIGPPPVAHFECDDPIKFEPRQTKTEQSSAMSPHDENTFLPANLETRKKRRESNTMFDSRRIHVFESSSPEKATHPRSPPAAQELNNSKPTLKAGAKRKLSSRDTTSETATKLEDFHYVRKTGSDPEATPRDNEVHRKLVSSNTDKSGVAQTSTRDRKVLGHKSTNLSPLKSVTVSANEKIRKEDMESLQPMNASTEKVASPREPIVTLSSKRTDSVDAPTQPPKTPAITDLISPTSTTTSTVGLDPRDTPPPSELRSGDTLQNGSGATRTARRARSQVNYAEPNLISKMRRSGKGLVDAVANGEKGESNTNNEPEQALNKSEEENPKMRTVVVKRQDSAVDWKQLSAAADADIHSPLRQKGSNSRSSPTQPEPSNSTKEARRDDNLRSTDVTASALAAASKRKRERTITDADLVDPAAGKLGNLTIFDFSESSPQDAARDTESQVDKGAGTKQSRRQSSLHKVPTETVAVKPDTVREGKPDSTQRTKAPNQQGTKRPTNPQLTLEKSSNSKPMQREVLGNASAAEAAHLVRATRRRSTML
ncbi:MAG: hypothetical protein M1821_006259 [Bathelium mastoideum]|nr:MAG: hypothetical protein M1821_006259 [Bathelium mastoideum]